MNTMTKYFIKFLVAVSFITMLVIVSQHYWKQKEQHLVATRQPLPPDPLGKQIFPNIVNRHQTHIPFLLYHKAIIITALINGRPTKCQVDTGSPLVDWVANQNLTRQRTGFGILVGDDFGHKVHLQEALLDNVQIGDLRFVHLRSYVVPSGRSNPNTVPTLGNTVFARMVLTIDYVKRELIIQPSVPNTVPLGVSDRRHVLDSQLINPGPSGVGVPCVYGKVMSLPAAMIIDTGLVSHSFSITRRLYERLLPQIEANHIKKHSANDTSSFGDATLTTLSRISSSFAGVSYEGPASIVNTVSPPAQAVLGYGFLKSYRITIDYPQNKIWLQENPSDT